MSKKSTSAVANPGGGHSVRGRGLVQLSFALSEDERRDVHAAAALAGQSATVWLREITVAAAREAVTRRREDG